MLGVADVSQIRSVDHADRKPKNVSCFASIGKARAIELLRLSEKTSSLCADASGKLCERRAPPQLATNHRLTPAAESCS